MESHMLFGRKVKTYLIDAQTISDGRIVPLIEKGLFQGRFLLVPRPIYEVIPSNNNEEAYTTRIKENIERIGKFTQGKIKINKKPLRRNDFLKLAKKYNATIIVSDNETKALLGTELTQKGIKFIVLNEIYDILKPDYLPGTEFKLVVTKKGKEQDEGIGYLDGGIKVVVTGGAKALGKELEVVVQGSIETNVGKLIFAKPKYVEVK